MNSSYESIVALIDTLSPSLDATLQVEWLLAERIGVAKAHRGGHALLLVGPPLSLTTDIVAAALRNGQWRNAEGALFQGSVLELPAGHAYRAAMATIGAELFRLGVERRSTADVFVEVEAFVALVLRRILLPAEYVLGLVGELLILRELLTALRFDARIHNRTTFWRGWQRQSRDFVFGQTAVEVKTTSLSVSRHTVSLDQVDARQTDGGASEQLFLASIGLRQSFGAEGFSISSLTSDVLALLDPSETASFLTSLGQYGPDGFGGYIHEEMHEHDAYCQGFTTTFAPRIYRMNDPSVRVIRGSDLARDFPHVLPRGLHYTVEFPENVPGSLENPTTDLRAFSKTMAACVIDALR